MDRRSAPRAKLHADGGGTLFLNKYIDGFPHLVKLVDLSAGGMLLRKVHEPAVQKDFFTVELGVPGRSERMWLWTRRVWEEGQLVALRFVGIDPVDRVRLKKLVDDARRAA